MKVLKLRKNWKKTLGWVIYSLNQNFKAEVFLNSHVLVSKVFVRAAIVWGFFVDVITLKLNSSPTCKLIVCLVDLYPRDYVFDYYYKLWKELTVQKKNKFGIRFTFVKRHILLKQFWKVVTFPTTVSIIDRVSFLEQLDSKS